MADDCAVTIGLNNCKMQLVLFYNAYDNKIPLFYLSHLKLLIYILINTEGPLHDWCLWCCIALVLQLFWLTGEMYDLLIYCYRTVLK